MKWDYPEEVTTQVYDRVRTKSQEELLNGSDRKREKERFSFTFDFSPMAEVVKKAIKDNYRHIIESDRDLSKIAEGGPLIRFRRGRPLRSELVNSPFNSAIIRTGLGTLSVAAVDVAPIT